MKNKWLSLFIPKVQIIVPTMTEVNRLRQRNVMIYGVKKHPDGYLVTVRKDILDKLEGYPVARTLSIYPPFLKVGVPIIGLVLILMLLMQKYTIGYRIDGNLTPQEQDELETLLEPHFQELGPFHFLKSDLDVIYEELKAYYNDYVWVNIYRKGTDIIFDVYDITLEEQDDDSEYSQTLFAKRSGLVKNYIVDSCRVLVEQNQVVKKGDPLVACYVEQPYTSEIIPIDDVARGEVWADTWYTVDVRASKSYVEERFTTNKETYYVLHLGGKEFTFPFDEINFEKYEEVDKSYDPFFFLKNSPLYLEKRQYYEKSDIIITNTYDEI
ncbi:sporulation protein, partial [Turicibacter sanguinis]|nr:sporulation protein [Turicibacter sanguinis]